MPAGTHDITIEQGATFNKSIRVKDSEGDFVNLSDVTAVRGMIRKSYSASDSYAFTLAVESAASGLISWTMGATLTASIPVTSPQDYIYDIEVVRTDTVERILQGTASISPEVTK